ncbi:hypothetical protein K7X08_032513 [Anisodus acutangulus]|uniref:Uncharacterized protein n=1 Tax=Anisodus acutangulus TaxID=402998 RepID=A0A9Q1LRA9_9SOLA|nr:hypothetical protein K7X08_032513 [Anisodus acutangulus]
MSKIMKVVQFSNGEEINNNDISTKEKSVSKVKENNVQKGDIDLAVSVDYIEKTMSGGHNSTEVAVEDLEEDHVFQKKLIHIQEEDVSKEIHNSLAKHIEDQANPDMLATKDNRVEELRDK